MSSILKRVIFTLAVAFISASLTFFASLTFSASLTFANEPPIPVKVVVVTMFENGEVTGDKPGEFQFWIERLSLDKTYQFKLGEYDLRMNDQGVLGICVGGGI